MADYFSGFGSSLGDKVLPTGDALKRKVDGQRENWLRGISTTKHGKKEDPTYLHFRFIFDFGDTSLIDPETFLPPSPLFRAVSSDNPLAEAQSLNNLDPNAPTPSQIIDAAQRAQAGNFYTDMDFFYGSKMVIDSRVQNGVFPVNGPVAYMGAQQFLAQRSVKRQQMLNSFRKGLKFINEKCPYYFQSLSGLDQLLKVDIKNFHKAAGKPQRAGTLTVECLESIDMRIFALSDLYRKAIYDYTYHRTMLPENLRKFRMWVVITEIRNIQLTYGINDVLNPFSIPSVAQGANFLDSFNSQTGLLDNTEGILQKTTGRDEDKFGSYELGPYAFIYQLDQCEFDFDDSYPSFSTIDNKGLSTPVSNKFKIHVGRVRDHKIQFNQIADVIQKNDNIKSMVLSDIWGPRTGDYADYDYFGSAGIAEANATGASQSAEYFAQLASNFITNSVADLKDQGVQILQGALLGNIYGLGGINPGTALRSVQSTINTVNNFVNNGVPNPFADNTPQGQGLGGPGQRQYPSLNEDAYTGVPSSTQENLGTAYSGTPGNPGSLNEDVYSTNPGTSLGLPDREYPIPGGDEYVNVPGSDSGVPGRVYPSVDEDLYNNNPGSDLGLPDRQYPIVGGEDEYGNVPGSDLGVPNRVYPTTSDDIYSGNPGAELGLPDRQYPPISEDQYPDQQQIETNNIGSIYPDLSNEYDSINTREYEDSIKVTTDNIGDVYEDRNNLYTEINETVYNNTSSLVINEPIGDVYEDNSNRYPQVNDSVYDTTNPPNSDFLGEVYERSKNTYPQVNDDLYPNQRSVSGNINDDVYKRVPGSDLGTPGRNYEGNNSNEYSKIPQQINVNNIGRVYPNKQNENNL